MRRLDTCVKRNGVVYVRPAVELDVYALVNGNTRSFKLKPWKLDQSRIRKLMSHMVIVHELPFTFAKSDLICL
uniref:Uncharacterized protein n=1 Tax=Kalanchoe fedtschenkoi TaxID=63787 RepID=A0A7N0THB8_KALFE